MLADKPTELSRIKLKTWIRQPVPFISEHSAQLAPLSVDFRTWLWRQLMTELNSAVHLLPFSPLLLLSSNSSRASLSISIATRSSSLSVSISLWKRKIIPSRQILNFYFTPPTLSVSISPYHVQQITTLKRYTNEWFCTWRCDAKMCFVHRSFMQSDFWFHDKNAFWAKPLCKAMT